MNPLLARYEKMSQSFVPEEIELRSALRVNTLKISEEELVYRLSARGVVLEKIPEIPFAYYFTSPFSLVSSEEYLLGYFYLQEVASQLPALALAHYVSGENVILLDACAAPGSKTTQLAQLYEDKTPIFACDVTLPRLKKLAYNVERLGISSVSWFRKDARFLFDFEREFDGVLLDVPCSGNFCIEQDFFSLRSPRDFADRARLQKELVRSAFAVTKEGGYLIYSTCSLEPEEDEFMVDWILKNFDVEILDLPFSLGDPGQTDIFGKSLDPLVARSRKLWPHRSGTQGFFIAAFKKNS